MPWSGLRPGGDLSSGQGMKATGAAPQEFVLVLAIFSFVSQADMAGALDPEITHTFHLVRRHVCPRGRAPRAGPHQSWSSPHPCRGACMRSAPCSAQPDTAE